MIYLFRNYSGGNITNNNGVKRVIGQSGAIQFVALGCYFT